MITAGFRVGIAVAAATTFPDIGLIKNQFALPIPERAPLNAIGHVVITEGAEQFANRIFENRVGVDRLKAIIDPP